MDQQENQNPESPTSQNVPPVMNTQPIIKPKSNVLPVVIAILISAIIFGIGGYFFAKYQLGLIGSKSQSSPTSSQETETNISQQTTHVSGQIVAVDDMTNKYLNSEFGFSFTFPKYNKDIASCQDLANGTTGQLPMKIFDAGINANGVGTLYISEENIVERIFKQVTGGGWTDDPSLCKIVPNSIDLINNGYNNGMTNPSPNPSGYDYSNSKPAAFRINYMKVENESDLNTLVQSTSYKESGCYAGSKKEITYKKDLLPSDMVSAGDTNPVYQISLVDANGKEASEPTDSCWINAVYAFFYSPTSHIAIITSGFQDSPFSGTNGQNVPSFEFLSQ